MLTELLLILALAGGDAKKPAYARPELLLEPAELAKPETAKKFVILDARGKSSYDSGHIPGAVHVQAGRWASDFGDGTDPAGWSKRIGGLGIDTDTPVVIYDASRTKDAARIWWILRYWGVKDVRLLNGGWDGWLTAGGKREEKTNTPAPRKIDVKASRERIGTRFELLKGLKDDKAGQIVDARSEMEFCGEALTAKRNGAIPGAKHLEWSATIDPKTGRFKTATELAKLMAEAGIDPKKPATTYCQSGGRAAVMAFVLELTGGKPARNYYRSWAEWGNADDTPIVKPKKK
jgi:thiosulfate/3-mercaptopyruvate sulfurtransferase